MSTRVLILTSRVIGALILAELVTAAGATAAPKSCLQHVSAALDALESGLTNEALASLSEAMKVDANDPLAHAAAGLALLCGGRSDDARQALAAAIELDDRAAEAEYGLGILALSSGDLAEAASSFCRAQTLDPSINATGAIEYVKALAGAGYTTVENVTHGECVAALNAAALMRQRRFGEALVIWQELQAGAVRPGFGERIGCSMTFLRSGPVALTGWPVKSYKPPVADRSKLTTVSGKVVLKADLARIPELDVVSFFVNDRLAGMTNHAPFQYTWDTERVPNGVHTVKIQAMYDGHPISEKSMQVLVRNANGVRAAQETEERALVRERLREALRLRPSVCAINYNLALCALEQGEDEAAAAALERVMAANPGYLDAGDRLAAIYRRGGVVYSRIGDVGSAGRRIALTFDDGPRNGSERLLEVLREKQVKATFFVVGKQAEAHPDILRKMADDGHDIQNHTYGHRALDLVPEAEILQEIFRTCVVVRSLTGRSPGLLRPPGGREGKRLPEVLRRFGMSSVFWTVNCVGAEGTTREQLVSRALSSVEPGAIILMHNYEAVTLLALPEIIDRLLAGGYEFVTVSEALSGRKSAPG